MSLSDFFADECSKRLKQNASLALIKLSDPLGMINLQVSSPLLEKALSSQGSFTDFVSKTIEENSELIAVSALGLASNADQTNIRNAFRLASSVVATAIVARNDVLLIFIKKIARNAQLEIEKKRSHLEKIRATIKELNGHLERLSSSNGEYQKYLSQLRGALVLLGAGISDLKQVRGTYFARDLWLSAKFSSAKSNIDHARKLILPSLDTKETSDVWAKAKNAVSSYYNASTTRKAGIEQLTAWGLPKDQGAMLSFKKIPLLARKVLSHAQDYTASTVVLNALLASYKLSLFDLKSALPPFLKTFTLDLLDRTISKGSSVRDSMDDILYKSSQDPLQPTKVVIYSADWAARLSVILANFDILPEKANSQISLDTTAVGVYESTVAYLKRLGNASVPGAKLLATEAEEDPFSFDGQMAAYGLTAIDGLTNPSKRKAAATLGKSLLLRIDLSISRDKAIAENLDHFIKVPLPFESGLEEIASQLSNLLGGMGFDKAAGALSSGKFSKFFKLNARDATTVGAGLTALAFLKKCLPDPEDQEKLSELQTQLERSEDLINFKLSVDFDLAIFKNLQDCVKFTNLASFAKIKESICGILTDDQSKTPNAVGRILGRLPV